MGRREDVIATIVKGGKQAGQAERPSVGCLLTTRARDGRGNTLAEKGKTIDGNGLLLNDVSISHLSFSSGATRETVEMSSSGDLRRNSGLALMEIKKGHAHKLQNIQAHYELELQKLRDEILKLESVLLASPAQLNAVKNSTSNVFTTTNDNGMHDGNLRREVSQLTHSCAQLEERLSRSHMEKRLLSLHCSQLKLDRKKSNGQLARYQELVQRSFGERRQLEQEYLNLKELELNWSQQLSEATTCIDKLNEELKAMQENLSRKELETRTLMLRNNDLQDALRHAFTKMTSLQDLVIQSQNRTSVKSPHTCPTCSPEETTWQQLSMETMGMMRCEDFTRNVASAGQRNRRHWPFQRNARQSSVALREESSDSESQSSSATLNSSIASTAQYDIDIDARPQRNAHSFGHKNPLQRTESDSWSFYSTASNYSRQSSDDARQSDDNTASIESRCSVNGDTDFMESQGCSQSCSESNNESKPSSASGVNPSSQRPVSVQSASRQRGLSLELNGNAEITSCAVTDRSESDDVQCLWKEMGRLREEKIQIEYQLQRIPVGGSGRRKRHSYQEQEHLEDRLANVTKNISSVKRQLKQYNAL